MAKDDLTANDVRHANTQEVLQNHEERITENERFRLRMQGAMALAGFMIGGGVATTILMWAIGAI